MFVGVTGLSNLSPVTFHFFFSSESLHKGAFFSLVCRLQQLICWLAPMELRQRLLLLHVSVSRSKQSATARCCQFGCALMILHVNCPRLVRHLHSVDCSFVWWWQIFIGLPAKRILAFLPRVSLSQRFFDMPGGASSFYTGVVEKCNNKQSLKSCSLLSALFIFFFLRHFVVLVI